ncbi:MAG TPA: GNAT family N-acetyltransferase [Bacillota bacterium]|nr:GNAT family N-acetyltransferase [Bacillota bacterium]
MILIDEASCVFYSRCAMLEIECLGANAWSEKQIAKRSALCSYLVAIEDGEPIGICSFYTVSDEIQIINIAVSPAFRKKGVASALLDKALSSGLPASLEVSCLNHAAIALYEKYRFKAVGKRKNFYRDSDALIMIKEASDEHTCN